MSRIVKIFACLSLSILTSGYASADLKTDTEYLADQVCAGRKTGTRGAIEAGWYIIKRLRESGYDPVMQAFTEKGVTGHNIICETKGNGPAIVIISHYDGLGEHEGVILPGADANASGTAALIWLAETLKNCGKKVIFVALDGHHLDLSGARSLHSRLRGRRIRAVINIDTIGSDLAPVKAYYTSYLIALGADDWKKHLEKRGKDAGIKVYFDYYGSREFTRLFYGELSDQAPFVADGTPAIMFTSGITSLNGKKEDVPETLNYDLFPKRLEIIGYFIKDCLR